MHSSSVIILSWSCQFYYYMQFGEFLWRTGKFCDVIERKLRKYSSLNIKIKFFATPFNNKIFQHIPALGRLDVQNSGIRQHYYPEGGWGWVVVLCTFLCNALTTGLLLSGAIAIVMAVRWYWYCCHVLLLLLSGAISIAHLSALIDKDNSTAGYNCNSFLSVLLQLTCVM